MKHLLDVNVLIAAILKSHARHQEVFSWLPGKEIAVCPLSELGFLRITTNPKAHNTPMTEARTSLELFISERNAERIFDDLPPLSSKPQKSDEVTDQYLADLAAKHGMKLATLDRGISHSSVEIIA